MAQKYNKKEVKKKLAEGRLEDFEFPPKEKFPSKFNKGVAFTRVNFNSTLFWGGIFGGKMIFMDCSFEDCKLNGINGRRVVFENCSFKNCILAKEGYSKFYKSSFKNCVFDENTIIGTSFITKSSFENCKFLARNVNGLWLKDCDLKSIIFYARHCSLRMYGCTLNDVDFSNAILTKSSFSQCSVSSARFPDSPDCFCIDPSIFEKAKSILKDSLSPSAYKEYCKRAEFESSQSVCLIEDRCFRPFLMKHERKIILQVLYNLRHEVEPIWKKKTDDSTV